MPDSPALLSETQKTEIRRHLGYPEPSTGLNSGGPPYFQNFGQSGAHIGDRYTPAFYDLEYRLISLSQTANAAILGGESPYSTASAASAQIAPTLAAGGAVANETLNVVVAGQVGSYTVQAGDTVASIVTALVGLIQGLGVSPQLFVASGTTEYVLISAIATGPLGNGIPVLAFGSPSVTLSVTDGSGNTCTSLRGGAEPPGPRYVDSTTGLTIYGHLPIIRFWETAIAQASENFDTLATGEYTADPHEYQKRVMAYTRACKDLAQTMAVVYYGSKSYRGREGLRRTY